MPIYVHIRPGDNDLLSVIARVDIVHIARGVKKCCTYGGVIAMTVFADWWKRSPSFESHGTWAMSSPVMAPEGSGLGRHCRHIQYQSPRGSGSRLYRRTLLTAAERLHVKIEIESVGRTTHNLITSIVIRANLAPIIVGPSASTCSLSRQP